MTNYQRHNTTLTPDTVATLKAYGSGNLSEGIRRAAELVRYSESVRGRSVWQPMDSAPTGGKPILLRSPTQDATIVVPAQRSCGQWIGAFWTGVDWARGIVTPDAWMPLPDADDA